MYFEIENTPEHIKKSRRKEVAKPISPREVSPRLVLAPFSRPPQVVFENVPIGTTCERELEVFNPSKQTQLITLGKALPSGLLIHLPGEWLEVEPETCYCLTLEWTPIQPTALRETIRFTNESRGRFDVIVVLKSAVNAQRKGSQPKGFKTSPGKMKKKQSKKSPVAVYKKKYEKVRSYQVTQTTTKMTTTNRILQSSNKENISVYDVSLDSQPKCPFDSPSSVTFDSGIFSNFRKLKSDTYSQNMYEKSEQFSLNLYEKKFDTTNTLTQVQNVLKPTNKQSSNISSADIFDNLTFTPLKCDKGKNDRLEKGPKIVMSLNSESELEDSIEIHSRNKENETHSIIDITSTQPPNKWATVNTHHAQLDSHILTAETPTIQNKKLPNTSSPKEMTSPNFTINTELSRISDLSFFPQRFSTERKVMPKFNNETHDLLLDEYLANLQSNTFTKDSPHEQPLDLRCKFTPVESKPPHFFSKEKMCRQSLFRESQQHMYEKFNSLPQDTNFNVWQNQLRVDVTSPLRSISPPLQTIPEESVHVADKTNKQMATFTIDRPFDQTFEHRNSMASNRQSWSKKNIRAEPELRKTIGSTDKFLKPKCPQPKVKESMSSMTNVTFDHNKSVNPNVSLQISNVYSQSTTVDPFSSTSYFYDEEAVDKFGKEFQRWLNCILTPPADLDSNVEQNIDVGKVWIDNRNKEVPAAPTKEQVCSQYHNSHRLESLRRSAKAMLLSPDFVQVFQKLNAQIEKKLIAIRTDRNLHLDVGLQKIIMEIILSYNPLWLRIGLEALYNLILPLRSNSDIEGLTAFIIQRMFKNPYLKNKHSKSSAPNMLLPAYMEAIKKYTLKKFFMLIYFLDQAKNRKLIPHDPCLFCRKAICKESREVIIRFSRELIAGIGDITKHLKPMGYVVTHKQCYLDEYKYAVHNIALDLRDGVRLTKVMEIILMKDGLLCQLRTPAISRLQKIHNVQVAFNALKGTNFVIEGDIKAVDIADGHREKTLSLLWQLIHVFRAPLFEKAANVIQTWWRKKYEVIVEKRKEEERILQKKIKSVRVIQHWWRQKLYKRYVQWRMEQVTKATVVVQKYCRMWIYRSRFVRIVKACRTIQSIYRAYLAGKQQRRQYLVMKTAAVTIQHYYRSYKLVKLQRHNYLQLKSSVIKLQALCRGFITRERVMRERAAIQIQKNVRRYLARSSYLQYREKVVIIQSLYRARLAGKRQRKEYISLKAAAISIQRYYRSYKLVKMEKENYQQTRIHIIKLQALCRGFIARNVYKKEKAAICIQKYLKMYVTRKHFLEYRKKVVTIQTLFRARLCGKQQRKTYLEMKQSTISIQRFYRAYRLMKMERHNYLKIKTLIIKLQAQCRGYLARKQYQREKSAICIQKNVRRYLARSIYLQYRQKVITIQAIYRARLIGRQRRNDFISMKSAATLIQRFYRSYKVVQMERRNYIYTRKSIITVQALCRGFIARQRHKKAKAAICIQKNVKRFLARTAYLQYKQKVLTIQSLYRAKLLGKQQRQSYLSIRTATIVIQTIYKSYRLMKLERQKYLQMKTSAIKLQRQFRAYTAGKQQKSQYISIKTAAKVIQRFYRSYKIVQKEKLNFLQIKTKVIKIQALCRGYLARQKCKREKAAICIQKNVKKYLARRTYIEFRQKVIIIQALYRAKLIGKQQRQEYTSKKNAAVAIQSFYRSYLLMKLERHRFLQIRISIIKLQAQCRGFLVRQKYRREKAAIFIQKNVRRCLVRSSYLQYRQHVITIQTIFRARLAAIQQRKTYLTMKVAATAIQKFYRCKKLAEKERKKYLLIKTSVIKLQAICRGFLARRKYKREKAALCIQKFVRCYITRSSYLQYRQRVVFIQRLWRRTIVMRKVRTEFLQKRQLAVKLQAVVRGYLVRKRISTERENLIKLKEEQRKNWAASKIQALFRGHKARVRAANDKRVAELRRRWRDGALHSTQESLKQRHEEAIEILRSTYDMTAIICAFNTLDLLTEVLPMIYNATALPFVRRVYTYMSALNRSLPSIEVLKSSASLLVNLTRYSGTGHKIYSREHVPLVLKLMLRFINNETHLFCILSTHLWLFSKYDTVREDLTEFLHKPDNHKILENIKTSVDRMKRMSCKGKDKNSTAQPRYSSNLNQTINSSIYKSNVKILYPALEPDYGITRSGQPRYFVDAQQAISCLYRTFDL